MIHKRSLIIYSISHLVVDFACFFVLYGNFSSKVLDLDKIAIGFLLYNAIAFAFQMIIGIVVDKFIKHHFIPAIIGIALVGIGVIIPFTPFIKLCICALGNGFFHIGGGINSLCYSNGKMARSGIFISFGALGVALGTYFGKNALIINDKTVAFSLLTSLIFILAFLRKEKTISNVHFNFTSGIVKSSEWIIYLSLFSIIIRSLVGFYTPIPWRNSFFMLPAICVFIGKFIGGMLADKFSPKKVSLVSLLMSALLLSFYNSNIILCSLGLILFNIVTSVTLCTVCSKLNKNLGFSFGLTTFALFLGTIPSFFISIPEYIRPFLIFSLCITSLFFIFLVTPKISLKKGEFYEKSVKEH